MIRQQRAGSGRAIAWMWGTAMVALLGAWAGVVLTEVSTPRFTTFAILWGLVSAGPLVATWSWAREERTRPPGESRQRRQEEERPARRMINRERRILPAVWISALPAAIVAALLTRWFCPESTVGLPMSMAGLLLVPAAVYTFLSRPYSST